MDQKAHSSDMLIDLLVRTAQRDRTAFAALYKATSAKLMGICWRILVRRDLAEECLQEAYVKIWEHAGSYDRAKASPIAWMAAIARNRALDDARRRHITLVEDAAEMHETAADLPHPLDSMEQSDELKRLLACLKGLDEDKRQVVLLAYYRGMSRDALAARFNRPTATIKTWLYRSLAQLKGCLAT